MPETRDHRRWRRQWREREEKKERKENEEERVRLNRYALMGASLSGTLLWSKGASEGDALLSTVVRARGRPATSTPWHLRVGLKYRIYFLGIYL
jgi:hypothetical protein